MTNNPQDVLDVDNLVIDFEAYDDFLTMGPELMAPGVVFTGDAGSILGAYIADLGGNGLWGAGSHFAATDLIGALPLGRLIPQAIILTTIMPRRGRPAAFLFVAPARFRG